LTLLRRPGRPIEERLREDGQESSGGGLKGLEVLVNMLSHYSSNTTLVSLLNRVNNLDEPKPIWNERSAILGIPMTFMVRMVLDKLSI